MPFLRVHSRKAIVLTLVVLCTLQLAPTHGEEWCTFLYDDGDVVGETLDFCRANGMQVSTHLWAPPRLWKGYNEDARRFAVREAAVQSGARDPEDGYDPEEAYDELMEGYWYDDDDVWYNNDDDEAPSYYTDFYKWYERQGQDLQEDHWRLRCGTMTTMDPLDEVNNRWCDEQAEVFRNCEREGGVCVN